MWLYTVEGSKLFLGSLSASFIFVEYIAILFIKRE